MQCIALPDYDWPRLREEFPGEFENPVDPSVVPTDCVPVAPDANGAIRSVGAVFSRFSPFALGSCATRIGGIICPCSGDSRRPHTVLRSVLSIAIRADEDDFEGSSPAPLRRGRDEGLYVDRCRSIRKETDQ